ncbi:unnamed protein product [Spirodela intermedia]|uniref:Uncharacterized protein n=1 Tax=Spirodela intermedia TaxID=51605 RepID=A0A7I8JQ05_SPIIN|nr:unnamed protein product [Spirodela intermedia]CAA6671885.1 unnamed protein product [Spirodela intermedia]
MAGPHLRQLLRRCVSSSTPRQPFSSSVIRQPASLSPPGPPRIPFSATRTICASAAADEASELARSISSALIKHAQASSITPHTDVPQYLSLHFSDVRFNTALLQQILNISAPAGRTAVDLFRWAVTRRSFTPSDESLSHMIAFLGRRRDFKSIQDLLIDFRRYVGPKTLRAAFDRLIRAGRSTQAVHLFQNLEKDYGIHGFGGTPERIVRDVADKIFPDVNICHELIRAWCVDGKLDQALRLMGEMSGGDSSWARQPTTLFSTVSVASARWRPEGCPATLAHFMFLFPISARYAKLTMPWKCFIRWISGMFPNAEIYLALIRSFYQAARLSEGDEMVEKMRSAGFGAALDTNAYYGFIKVLCGIERVDHAMKVFRMAKGYGFVPGVKTYGLLIEKLWAHNQVCRANTLLKEAVARGVTLAAQAYSVDPRYVKMPKEKKKPRRLTLPEKMERKRKRLRKLRLSFVKKPKGVRRAY